MWQTRWLVAGCRPLCQCGQVFLGGVRESGMSFGVGKGDTIEDR